MHSEAIFFFVKGLGCLLIVAGSTGIGIYKAGEMTKRIEALKELQRLFLILKNEIRYMVTPVPDAMGHVADRCSGDYSQFFRSVELALYEKNGRSLGDIWQENVNEHLDKGILKEQDIRLICEIGSNIGYLDKEMQLSAMELYMGNLETMIEYLTIHTPGKKRVQKCLWAFGGFLLVIILI